MSTPIVDLVVLSRDTSPLSTNVQRGIDAQTGVQIKVHRVAGTKKPHDSCRWETIARARNLGKRQGSSSWLMFLDDDVVLEKDAIIRLLQELSNDRCYGALAADYLGESESKLELNHVTMGATLFRREALDCISFRFVPAKKCECQCCCDDLRRNGFGIRYSKSVTAKHLDVSHSVGSHSDTEGKLGAEQSRQMRPVSGQHAASGKQARQGLVMSAFNRRHFRRFRYQFLESFRATGSDEEIRVAGYGLLASQRRTLERLKVNVYPFRVGKFTPARNRLTDFQKILADVEDDRPVAYWDAGDVIFQRPVAPLWDMVRQQPEKLLVARELLMHPKTKFASWALSIHDPESREKVFSVFSQNPTINAGFAASTASTMKRYLVTAEKLRNSKVLDGTLGGDQPAMNLHLRSNPELWTQIDDGWNYCINTRPRDAVQIEDGLVLNESGEPVPVVHGPGNVLFRVPAFRRLSSKYPKQLATAAYL